MSAHDVRARASAGERDPRMPSGRDRPVKEPIVVTDGEERAALAVVRSLGRAGYHVIVCSGRRPSLASMSRYRGVAVQVPDPLQDAEGFAVAVGNVTVASGAKVVLPVSEAALLALSPVRHRLGPAVIPFPEAACIERICDKATVLAAAAQEGITTPRQVAVASPACGNVSGLTFPVVVKPTRSVRERARGRFKTGVRHAASGVELAAVLRSLDPCAYPVLIQERIVGPGIGVFVLLWQGRLLAAFGHRRLREKPPAGGVSVLRESVALDEALLQGSLALLRRLGWEGVAMVEYKLDERGTPHLMEINGRFWGSLQLAVDAGVDFPVLLVEAVMGCKPTPVLTYRLGVRTRWGWGDVDHLLAVWTRSPEALALPPGAPGRVASLRDFLLAFGPGTRGEVFRWGDPGPFALETLQWLRGR